MRDSEGRSDKRFIDLVGFIGDVSAESAVIDHCGQQALCYCTLFKMTCRKVSTESTSL